MPDLKLLRPHADFYHSDRPTAANVLLLVEVTDSSLAWGRGPRLASALATACRRCGR